MKQLCLCTVLLFVCLSAGQARCASQSASNTALPNFTLHKLGNPDSGPTMLVIGGIQGDEPGGFSAASLLVTHYNITRGSVWVVPNLNFPSIIYSHRGLHGDMNRKFANLAPSDPEYDTVRSIQSIILDPQVELVLNLHDGSGWYRHKWEDNLKNPNRWGQCIVIDQAMIDDDIAHNTRFQDLHAIASSVKDYVNVRLLRYLHVYNIKNTTTRNYDHDMEKTLSYFAVCAGKAAFGLEASKELPAASRAYYHACMIEGFMQEMGIEFERKFTLSPGGVTTALNKDVFIALYNNRTVFRLDNARGTTLGYIPVRTGANELEAAQSNPLLAVLPDSRQWSVVYGNRTLTRFTPEYMPFDDPVLNIELSIDGRRVTAQIGDMLKVENDFMVHEIDGFRVNAIGALKEVNGTEAGVLISRADFTERFSLDRDGHIYRVEFYKENAFCGMILVNFGPGQVTAQPNTLLTAEGENEKAAHRNTGR